MVIVFTKQSKNGTTIRVFEFSLLILVRDMFLSKAFSMVGNGDLSDFKVELLQKFKFGGQITLMEVVLVLTCKETQKNQ